MLFVLALALIILLFILCVHYCQHFQIHVTARKRIENAPSNQPSHASTIQQTQMSLLRTTNYTPHCCFALSSIDDEEFDFFPISFLLYLAFMASLCILMIVTQTIHYFTLSNRQSWSELLFWGSFSFKSDHNQQRNWSKPHTMDTNFATDYILIYAVMALAVWVSLFSFYRYYTTLISTKTLQTVSTAKLFKKFAVYALIFCILFMLQIHVYYGLFPVLIVLFCSFNFFCCYKFAAMLVKHYRMFIDINEMRLETQDILQCVLFTKNTSLFCSLLQSINLSVFVITYDVNILYYLPILWSISAFVLSLNFVRNYKFLQKHLFVFKRCCQCVCYKKVKSNTNTSTNPPKKTEISMQPTNTNTITTPQTAYNQKPQPGPIQIMVHLHDEDKYHEFDQFVHDQQLPNVPPLTLDPSNITKHSQSLDLYDNNEDMNCKQPPSLLRAQSDPLAALCKTPPVESNAMMEAAAALLSRGTDTMRVYDRAADDMESVSLTLPGFSSVVKKQKALELLGITTPVTPRTPSKSLQPTSSQNKMTHDVIIKPLPLSRLRRFSGLPKLSSLSKAYRDIEFENENDGTPEPTSPLALHLNVTPLVDELDRTKNIDFDVPSIAKIDEQRSNECVMLKTPDDSAIAGGSTEAGCPIDVTSFGFEFGKEITEEEAELPEVEGRTVVDIPSKDPRLINHVKTHSAPPKQLDEMFISLDILAKYGFCSRQSINSVKQLNAYQQTLYANKEEGTSFMQSRSASLR